MWELNNMLIGIFLLGCIQFISNQVINNECLDNPTFTCDKSNLNQVTIGGNVFKCTNNDLCNIDYRSPCTPCIGCNPKHACIANESLYVINGQMHQCPKYQICNWDPKPGSCEPCVEQHCSNKGYSCDLQNPSVVIIEQSKLNCQSGTVCNKDYKQPCSPCIEKTGTAVPSPNKTFVPPNCNDGLSGNMPCRPGPAGSDYYFKCKRRWCWYEQEMMHCSHQTGDKLCRNDLGICRK